MHRVNVNFSDSQIKRLLKGHTVQVSASELKKSSTTPILLNNKQFSTYKRSLNLGKGMRFQIAPELMQDNHMILGQGIKKFFKNVGKTVKSVSKKVYKDAIKPTLKDIKASAKSSAKDFAMDALASNDIRGYVKDNAKNRALEWGQDEGMSNVRRGFNRGVVLGEEELEQALIDNHNFDPSLARQLVTAGSHRLTAKAYDELMNIDDKFNEARNKPSREEYQYNPDNVSELDSALMSVANGAGLRYGSDYRIVRGGRLSFKGFLRKLRKGAKKVLQVAKPILKPIAGIAGTAIGTAIGGPTGAAIGNVIGTKGYDMVEEGLGMRRRRVGGSVKKGGAEAKAIMARVRAAKKTGGALVNAGYRGRGLRPAGYY